MPDYYTLQYAIDKYANSSSTPGAVRALERVIIFRDGVSDGELQKVKQEEILKIKGKLFLLAIFLVRVTNTTFYCRVSSKMQI